MMRKVSVGERDGGDIGAGSSQGGAREA